jgi:hypothetical protein
VKIERMLLKLAKSNISSSSRLTNVIDFKVIAKSMQFRIILTMTKSFSFRINRSRQFMESLRVLKNLDFLSKSNISLWFSPGKV